MKKHFVTGLVVLLPLALTLAVVFFIINFLTSPFIGIFEGIFDRFSWYGPHQTIIHFFLKIFLVISLFLGTVLLGFLTRAFVFKSFLSFSDFLMHRIPLIKTIYKGAQQIIKTIFGSSSRSFKQVAMVPFPTKGAWTIGLISSPAPALCEKSVGEKLITVFVPTTPNPTSGYLMMYREEEVVYIDMKVEDALKYVISCGVITENEGILKKPTPSELKDCRF